MSRAFYPISSAAKCLFCGGMWILPILYVKTFCIFIAAMQPKWFLFLFVAIFYIHDVFEDL